MAHWVVMSVDGSDTEVIDVVHSWDEAIAAGHRDVTTYYEDGDPGIQEDIAAFDASLAEALNHPHAPQDRSDVQFECGSASYDIRILQVGDE